MASHQFAFHKGLYCCSPFDFADATLRANGATGEVVPHPFVLSLSKYERVQLQQPVKSFLNRHLTSPAFSDTLVNRIGEFMPS